MQGHIVVIGEGRAENWDVARKHRLWAGRRGGSITAGDLLFFWEAKAGLKYVARATSNAQPVAAGEFLPWQDHVVQGYRWKYGLEILVESPHSVESSWKAVQELIDSQAQANSAVIPVRESSAVERLLRLFPDTGSVELEQDGLDWPSGYDARDQVVRSVAVRRGQRPFRQALLAAYGSACAMSGCKVEAVLEAAHIAPYRGALTNDPRNGLLLRADLHTLFDLQLLTVLPVGVIRTSPELAGSEYEDLDERLLRKPQSRSSQPDRGRLSEHNDRCIWLT